MEKKTVRDIDVKGKKVLVRCDFNVPIKDGEIADDTRIRAALPTIKYLLENGAKVVLCSHLGRPKGEVNEKYSLTPVAKKLSQELGKEVKCAEDVTGPSAKDMANRLQEGEAGLLENVRFDPREEQNDDSLAIELSELIGNDGVYVNDAFGTAHRAHASTEGVAHHVDEAVAGLLMEREIEKLGAVLENPEKPFVAILGGAKVSDKIGVIENLMDNVQTIVIGGAMANTFLKARGYDIGSSKYEEDKIDDAKEIMKKAFEKCVEIVLPKDVRVAKIPEGTELTPELIENSEHKKAKLFTEKEVEEGKGESLEGWQILDVGDTTLTYFADRLEGAKTVVWNGPLGYTEVPEFAQGTQKIATFISHTKAKCVIGGGDSVAAIQKIKKAAKQNGEDVKQEFSNIYLSTGGGASLEFLEGKTLPGIVALNNKEEQKCKSGENGNCKSNEQQIAD